MYFDKLFAAFGHMQGAGVIIPKQLQVIIMLTALPQKWEMLVSIVTRDTDLEDLNLSDICNAVIGQYQSESICYGSGKQNANKISVVKCKHSDLNWQN